MELHFMKRRAVVVISQLGIENREEPGTREG